MGSKYEETKNVKRRNAPTDARMEVVSDHLYSPNANGQRGIVNHPLSAHGDFEFPTVYGSDRRRGKPAFAR